MAIVVGGCGDSRGPESPPAPPEPQQPAAQPAQPSGSAPTTSSRVQREQTSRAAGEPATVVSATELKGKPFVDAPTVAALKPNTRVQVLDRQGGWYRVRSGAGEGWVRLLAVRRGTGATGEGAMGVDDVAGLATGRGGTGNVAATSGIRGLTPGELRDARPDTRQLERLQGFAADRQAAEAHARKRGLTARPVDYLTGSGP